MRYATDHNDETRERILEAAPRLFRQHGIAAVGLAKIMAEAGLTVGTFYTHFKSKEALLQEALVRSLDARHEELGRTLQGADLEVVVRAYLSPEHRDASGTDVRWRLWRQRWHGTRALHDTPLPPTTPRPLMHLPRGSRHGKAKRWAAQTRRPSWGSSPGRCNLPARPDPRRV